MCIVACRALGVTACGAAGRQTAEMASAAAARRTKRTLALAGAPWAPTVLRAALPAAPAATCAAEDAGRHVNVLAVRTRGPLLCSAHRARHTRHAAGRGGGCLRCLVPQAAACVRRRFYTSASQRYTPTQPRPLRGSAAAPPLRCSETAAHRCLDRVANTAGGPTSPGRSTWLQHWPEPLALPAQPASAGLAGWHRSTTGRFGASAAVHTGAARRPAGVRIQQDDARTNAYVYQRAEVARPLSCREAAALRGQRGCRCRSRSAGAATQWSAATCSRRPRRPTCARARRRPARCTRCG